MSKIAIDVTPILPGGINGGAKPMVVALLQELPLLLADDEFILCTANYNHDELAFLDCPNLKRISIHDATPKGHERQSISLKWFVKKIWTLTKHWFPQPIQQWLLVLYYRIRPIHTTAPFLQQQNIDFLFCPFGAPTFYDPSILTLSVVYDLQFLDYPDFFTKSERFYRQLNFDQICQLADHVVTISEFTWKSVIKNSTIQPEQVTTIHIGLLHDYSGEIDSSEVKKVLDHLKLDPQRYLFYPANFWAHKNHRALLQAFQLFRQKYPESDLKIVCTGALDDRRTALFIDAEKMGLDQHIVMPGFLPDQEIGILYRYARGLIFPSLYEGFGMPLLEAMHSGIPVACSNVTSLPEIGGDAVLYFNPESVLEIYGAMETLEFNHILRDELIQKGYQRILLFGDGQSMARNYGDLIHRMLDSKKKIYVYGIHGLTEDRWFQKNAYLVFPNSLREQFLEFSIHVPEWMPGRLEIILKESDIQIAKYSYERGKTYYESLALPRQEGILEIHFSRVYTPASLGIAEDHRSLSSSCVSFQIKSSDGKLLFDALHKNSDRENA